MRVISEYILNILFARKWILTVLFFPLLLNGCFNPHPIDDQAAVHCEAQGLRRGTDANAGCALKYSEEQRSSGAPLHQAAVAPTAPPQPPVHPGGVPQTLSKSVMTGMTATVNFAISLNPDCSVNGLPTVKINKQPEHGSVKPIQRSDYARFSQSNYPIACRDRKVMGTALDYTTDKNYVGPDSIEFETVGNAGYGTFFKISIMVEKLPIPDDL